MFAKIFILLLLHLISSVQLNHRFSDTLNYIQKLGVTSGDECENQGYIKFDPREVVIDERTNEEVVDPHCGTAKQCEDDAIRRDAELVQNLFFTKGKSLVKISSNLTFDPIPVVNECVPEKLTNHLKSRVSDPPPPTGKGLEAVGAFLSTTGTTTSAIGGVMPLIATSAVGGPIGLVAVGTAVAVVGTILPFFGPPEPEPMTKEEIEDLVNNQMVDNNDKLIKGVNKVIGDLAVCVNDNLNALDDKINRLNGKVDEKLKELISDILYLNVQGDMVLTSKALGMLALNRDGASFASDAHAILNDKCLTITEYTLQVIKGQVSVKDSILVAPMVKTWLDYCKASMWAFLIGSSDKKNPEGFESKGVALEQTILAKSAFVLGEFANYFRSVFNAAGRFQGPRDLYGYWVAAESDKQLFNIMLEHSEMGITYPRLTQNLNPTHHTYCRVCGMLRWNKIGRRERGNKKTYGGFDNWDDCYKFWGSPAERWECFYKISYRYYQTSTSWYGRRVSSLPGKDAGIANNAAFWRGMEWGYYDYSCDRYLTGFPSTHDGSIWSYGLCHDRGGTLFLHGDQ